MSQNEENLSETNSNINTTSDVPAKPFRISVELPLFLVMMGLTLSGVAISNIVLYRTCVHSLNYTKEECKVFLSINKTNQSQHEEEVQKYATVVLTIRGVLEALVPAVLSFFLGVWSDTHGRKPLIVWPMFGVTISAILMVVYSLLDDFGPWWYILTVIPYSLTGGFSIFFTGAYCYLSDVTTSKNRSLRMTILEASISVGSVIGGLLSVHILRLVGNVYLILISAALYAVGYAFSVVCIQESIRGALQGGVTSVLDFLLVKEMVRECFKRRPNHGRAQILLLTVANSLSIFILYGVMGLEYMYVREKLHWAIKEYTTFSAVGTTIEFCGAFLGIALFQRLFKLSDLVVANVAILSNVVNYGIRTFAVESWHMYLAASISLFRGLSSPLIRSFLTKILPIVDIAKVFALMSAIEGICPLLSPPLYNVLYEYTITTFPGAVYLLSGGIAWTCFVFIGIVQYFRWNVTSQYQILESAPAH